MKDGMMVTSLIDEYRRQLARVERKSKELVVHQYELIDALMIL